MSYSEAYTVMALKLRAARLHFRGIHHEEIKYRSQSWRGIFRSGYEAGWRGWPCECKYREGSAFAKVFLDGFKRGNSDLHSTVISILA